MKGCNGFKINSYSYLCVAKRYYGTNTLQISFYEGRKIKQGLYYSPNFYRVMSQYMVEIMLPAVMSEEFTGKIPAQRKKINELMEQGKLMSYALSEDYSKLWCVVRGESEFEVMSLISEFPLIDFMDPKISKLMFNNVVALRLPMFSLN